MVIKYREPRHPRQGPSCLLILFVAFGVMVGMFVIQNADEVRETIIPTPTPEPTRSATEFALLAQISEEDGALDEALAYYQEAVRLDATNAEIYIRFINLLVLTNHAEDALQRGEEAVILAPENDRVWAALASAYLANGDRLYDAGDPNAASLQYAQAYEAAETAIALNPENSTAYAYSAAGLVLQGDANLFQEAQRQAETAVTLDPNNPIGRYYMAQVLTNLAFYEAAREQYQLGIQADPSYTDLHIGLAYNFFAASRLPEAILTFQDALEVDPNNAAAYDGLAYMYLQLGQDVQAEENAEKSVELNPDVARAHGRLGEAYMRLNKFDLAIEQFNQAVTLYGEPTPLNARFFYLLANAYVRKGYENCETAVPLLQAVTLVSPAFAEDAQELLIECRRVDLEPAP
jgi:superkiller protein 3